MSNGPTYGEGAPQAPPVGHQQPPPQGYWYWAPHPVEDRYVVSPHKKKRLTLVPIVFLLLSSTCLMASIFLPWYSIEVEWRNDVWGMDYSVVEEHDLKWLQRQEEHW